MTSDRIVLHLGAHKTATSYLQARLGAARDELARRGVGLLLPEDLRPQDALRSPSRRRDEAENAAITAAARDALSALIAERLARFDRLVISEEGFLGTSRQNLATGSLYPDLALRLGALPDRLSASDVTLAFAVRGYAGFYASSFTTVMRRGKVFRPKAVVPGLMRSPRGWPEVLADLRQRLPSARLRLWRYEDFAEVETRLLALFGAENIPALEGDPVFRTFSQTAVRKAIRRADEAGRLAGHRKVLAQLSKSHPITAEDPAFRLFADENLAEMSLRYDRDWGQIVALHGEDILHPVTEPSRF